RLPPRPALFPYPTLFRSIADLRIPTEDLSEDHDQDGLTSDVELQLGTDPLAYDTDHDKLSDGQELERGTDPLDPDTNGDGLFDGDRKSTRLNSSHDQISY